MSPQPSAPRTCTHCGTPDLTEACPQCTAAWEHRRDVTTMTPQERVDELNSWSGILEIDFGKMHQRIEELVGRPVWTHEFADFDLLAHEVLTGSVPTMDGIFDKLPHDKPVIPVVVTNGDASKGSNNDQH